MKLDKFLVPLAVIVSLVLGVALGTGVSSAFANVDNEGFSSIVFRCPKGYACVTLEEYALHWDVCPVTILDEPTATPTNGPESTPTSTPPVVETPTSTPPVDPTPTPSPTDEPREKCNRGIGNFAEGCDPGNSYGQGKGGGRPAGEDRYEDQGAPGNQNHEPNPNKGGSKK